MTQGHRTTNVRRWNRDKIIAAIQERQRLGLKLTDVAKLDVGLFSAACRHFGNWANAVKAAGLTPAFPKWSQQRVLEVIRRHQQQGLSLTGIWSSDRPLYLAARRHFGSWQSALAAAGLPTTRRQKWSRDASSGNCERGIVATAGTFANKTVVWPAPPRSTLAVSKTPCVRPGWNRDVSNGPSNG